MWTVALPCDVTRLTMPIALLRSLSISLELFKSASNSKLLLNMPAPTLMVPGTAVLAEGATTEAPPL